MILDPRKAVFLLCDVQERFIPRLPRAAEFQSACQRLVEAAVLLSIPLIVTEQNPTSTTDTFSL